MKITNVTPVLVNNFLYVEVETDAGIKGLGEAGAWGFLEACVGAVQQLKSAILGQDPLRIEYLWNYMYRCYHFRGAVIMSALSAIDIALWDIAGKHFGVPVYQLLGGRCRDKARVYYHAKGETQEKLMQGINEAKALGFNAVGHLNPLLDSERSRKALFKTNVRCIEDAIDAVRQYREAAGDEMDLCIEIHRRCSIHDSITLARGIEKYHPYFYKDPVKPDNFDDMAEVSRKIHIPIATGERFHTPQEFAMLLRRRAVQFARISVCIGGGITGARKIAALAEAVGVEVIPQYNPLSPVSTMACLQIAAAIPNFAILEYMNGQDAPPQSEIVGPAPKLTGDGFMLFNTTPGIGMKILPGAVEKYPFKPWNRAPALNKFDGSIL